MFQLQKARSSQSLLSRSSPYQGPPCTPYTGPSRARTTNTNTHIEEVEDSEPPQVAAKAGKTTAEEAIDFIKGLGDDVKDQVIQKVFMPQDF
jgi:hypothetical protein